MIDCGEDWLGKVDPISPDAIFVTHAHPDHAFGLREGADCPVYATADAWRAMASFPIADPRIIKHREPVEIGAIRVEAFPAIHSIRAPAVGYRIGAGRVAIFYVPDVIDIVDRHDALSGIRLYIGDGASLTRPLVRRKGDKIFGHTTVRAQLGWCRDEGVTRATFTHCGSQIVEGDRRQVEAVVRKLGRERGIDAGVAHDGMELMLR
jgi:phosphoribosyl 1,2-cyclic phosphodiesterase